MCVSCVLRRASQTKMAVVWLVAWITFGGLTSSLWFAQSASPIPSESSLSATQSDENFEVLESLCELARSQEMCVYAISEIHNSQQRTVQIQPASRCHNIYSVAKLFVVTAIGILEDEGKIDTEERVYPIFEKKFPTGYDAKWERVKVSDVMRHRMGLDHPGFLDIDAEDPRTWPTEDFLQIVLSHPLAYEPGEESV